MRRVVITKSGPPEVLSIVEEADLEPGEGEVVVRVHRAGINFADLMMRLGIYGETPEFPFTPGYEVAGVISSLAADVEGLEVGQRVAAFTGFGGYAEEVCVPAERVLPLREEIDFDAAAAMLVTYITSYHMLIQQGNMQPGDTVLIHHAAGGVGTAALQIARARDAGAIFGVASGPKRKFVEGLGMRFIDREQEDFVAVVKAETGGAGVHHALDPVGGAHLRRSYKALRSGGKLYVFGGSSFVSGPSLFKPGALLKLLRTPKFSLMEMMGGNKSVFGIHMGTLKDHALMRREMEVLSEMLHAGSISPIVDKVFAFEDVGDAHHYIHARRNRGKVLLDFSPR